MQELVEGLALALEQVVAVLENSALEVMWVVTMVNLVGNPLAVIQEVLVGVLVRYLRVELALETQEEPVEVKEVVRQSLSSQTGLALLVVIAGVRPRVKDLLVERLEAVNLCLTIRKETELGPAAAGELLVFVLD